jgi:hypothetical protein
MITSVVTVGARSNRRLPARPGDPCARRALFNQPMDGHTDRSGSEPDVWAKRIHRERTLGEERFPTLKSGLPSSVRLMLGAAWGAALETLS